METAEVLRKIKDICTHSKKCNVCPLIDTYCGIVPQHWKKKDIAEMAKVIDDYKEDKK